MTLQQLLQHLKDNLVLYYLHYKNPGDIEFTIGLPSQDNIHFEQSKRLNDKSIDIIVTLNGGTCKNCNVLFNNPEFALIQEVYQMLREKLMDENFCKRQNSQVELLQKNTTELIQQLQP